MLQLWLLDIGLAQVYFGGEWSGFFFRPCGGDDEQGRRWIWSQFLIFDVLIVTIDAQFLKGKKQNTFFALAVYIFW